MVVTYPAPAKLNLDLHITGQRKDGYHTLESHMVFIGLYDHLTIEMRLDGVICRKTALLGIPEADDLAIKAAKLLQRHFKVKSGAEIAVEKKIPVGRGLGGGSSDAATVLLVLNHLWGLELPKTTLMDLALSLGADVPFFIFGKNAIATGVGEKLQEKISPVPCWYLVLIPMHGVSTRDAFAWWDEDRLTEPKKRNKIITFLKNDLQEAVCARVPEVKSYLELLGQDGRMTGSGSALFKAFARKEEALLAASNLPKTVSWLVVEELKQHPLHDFWGVAKW